MAANNRKRLDGFIDRNGREWTWACIQELIDAVDGFQGFMETADYYFKGRRK
jgi:hypothetical protein